jgi:putative intracellular protease/amidase
MGSGRLDRKCRAPRLGFQLSNQEQDMGERLRFSGVMKMLSNSWTPNVLLAVWLAASSAGANDLMPIRVALYDDAGSFGKGVPRITEQLGKVKDVKLTVVSGKQIVAGALDDYDVVIFSGGSGSKQSAGIGNEGIEAVRKFVKNGGGYVGICGGAFLACSGFTWGLGIVNAKTVSPKWQRGKGPVQIEITAPGETVTGFAAGVHEVLYHNGPILKPAGRADLPEYEPLAIFRTELAEHDTPKGAMVNTPAWIRGTCGKGRVLISSPHPEQQEGMEPFVEHAVRWVAGR